MQNEGIRDKKRRETRRRILEEAVALVDAHGFDNVTVDDICEAAGISRRTFFNYMDSKDEAVLGTFPFVLTEDSLEAIRTTETDNMLALIFASIEVVEADGPTPSKRHTLLESNPSLMHAEAARKRGVLTDVGQAVLAHFERFPGDRQLTGDAMAETHIIVGLFRIAVSRYLWSPPADTDPIEGLRHHAQDITNYAKELTW